MFDNAGEGAGDPERSSVSTGCLRRTVIEQESIHDAPVECRTSIADTKGMM